MDSPTVFCRILGPIAIEIDGAPAQLGGPRSRRALAALSAAHGMAVPDEYLIEQIWGDARPASVVSALRGLIWRLRAALGPQVGPRYLRRDVGGYALTIPGPLIDHQQLAARVAGAMGHLDNGHPSWAAMDLAAAVALWRGEPWEELGPAPELIGIRAKLAELHDVAVEELQAARLALDDPAHAGPETARAVAALAEAVVATPYRERRWELLALGLYRTGRQTEALAALRGIHERLINDIGIEPRRSLRALEQRILRQDPDLLLPGPTRAARPRNDR
ncbi:BTAD domain-containing putative transcriptional regulator [Nocardia sp. NPDC058666]|uniref:AfsR/SARP family transcriptional regulator n=1 Tax=Nocardia sp. NPDC058666 TaxID=3346587 RepID=UPI00365E4FAB